VALSLSSPAAVRFLAAVSRGHRLKALTRMPGINEEVGYRFLRDRYLGLRWSGLGAAHTIEVIGRTSSRLPAWEALVGRDHS